MENILDKKDNVCKHCKKGLLNIIEACEPYHNKHLQCNFCDSTYSIIEIEENKIWFDTPKGKVYLDLDEYQKQIDWENKNLSK